MRLLSSVYHSTVEKDLRILVGDSLTELRKIPDKRIYCCVTSVPYWQLRDYSVEGQLGMEPTIEEYIDNLVEVFREVKRTLKDTGSCFINIGDTYSTGSGGNGTDSAKQKRNKGSQIAPRKRLTGRNDGGNSTANFHGHKKGYGGARTNHQGNIRRPSYEKTLLPAIKPMTNIPPKNLLLIPQRLLIRLQDDGWIVRSVIIFAKPNPMPESVHDRPAKSYEHILFLTKSQQYYYDYEAVMEPAKTIPHAFGSPKAQKNKDRVDSRYPQVFRPGETQMLNGQSMRLQHDVWEMVSEPSKLGHYAQFPSELPRRCILAGCPEGGTVMDIFSGTGTTGAVAILLDRRAICIELNPEYAALFPARFEEVQKKMQKAGRLPSKAVLTSVFDDDEAATDEDEPTV
jgi:DNA modification methylase